MSENKSYDLLARIAKAAGCLPSMYVVGNEHIVKAINDLQAKNKWLNRKNEIAFEIMRINDCVSEYEEAVETDTLLESEE